MTKGRTAGRDSCPFALPASSVSLWTLDGRQSIRFVCGERQRELLAFQRGESDLALVRGHVNAAINIAWAAVNRPLVSSHCRVHRVEAQALLL